VIRVLPALLLLCVSASGRAQNDSTDGRAALVVGPTFALTVRAPQGWVLDTKAGRKQGLQAVLYPRGASWGASPVVMYCQVLGRDGTRDRDALIRSDIETHQSSAPTALVAEQEKIVVRKGGVALVERFAGGARGTIEETAYLEERTVVVLFVLSSRDTTAFHHSLASFRDLVGSYSFLADDAENIQRAIEAVKP